MATSNNIQSLKAGCHRFKAMLFFLCKTGKMVLGRPVLEQMVYRCSESVDIAVVHKHSLETYQVYSKTPWHTEKHCEKR